MELKESLEACVALWKVLAENPQLNKDMAAAQIGLSPTLSNDCPCCEYVLSCGDNTCFAGVCNNCPLTGLWETDPFPNRCTNGLYGFWVNSINLIEKSFYASKIAKAAEKRLKDFTY